MARRSPPRGSSATGAASGPAPSGQSLGRKTLLAVGIALGASSVFAGVCLLAATAAIDAALPPADEPSLEATVANEPQTSPRHAGPSSENVPKS